MKRTIEMLTLLLLLPLAGCQFTNRSFVNFTEGQEFDRSMFYVVSQRTRDVSSSAIPTDCYLPDGTAVTDYMAAEASPSQGMTTHSNSTSMAAVIQSLFGWGGNKKLVELSGVYESVRNVSYFSTDKTPVMLSGKVIMPADGKFKRFMLVSHYTIGSNAEAPSNCFSLEGIFAKLGYCVIISDYLGYGVTANQVHPYLMMDATAYHVVSMFFAVRKYLESKGIKPQYDDIYLLGYSQGGATTMAVQRMIEEEFAKEIKIRRNFAGGGVYDVKATYDRFVETNEASYPVAVPLVLQGMIVGNPSLNIELDSLVSPRIAENIDEWVNSKKYTTAQINKAIGTRVTSEILSPLGMNRSSEEVSELYKALSENSIIYYDWQPEAPVYMLHSIDDETVPFEANAARAKQVWSDANIMYNFGNYGTHVKTCLRFLYTVKPILEDEDK